jgi:hypothetical protein
MSIGGTVYAVRGGTDAIEGVTITIVDAHGSQRSLISNSAGNFYVFKSEWDPVFPLTVDIAADGAQARMTTTIGRDGACATCHRGSGDSHHMPAVYLRAQ